jgi:tRNA(Met) cytidine acetyltransferase
LLGSECDILVINASAGVNWELVAAASGCVRGGGMWLLLTPPAWPAVANPAAAHLLSYPTDAALHHGEFHHWIARHLDASAEIIRYQNDVQQWHWPKIFNASSMVAMASTNVTTRGQRPSLPVTPTSFVHIPSTQTTTTPHSNPTRAAADPAIQDGATTNYLTLTDDQQVAIAAIHKVAFGHRWRPLVINAHRGRGKSALLGIAAKQLRQAGKTTMVITGPHPAAVQIALQHAAGLTQSSDKLLHEGLCHTQPSRQQLDEHQQPALRFIPVDVLLASKVALDVLFIDEAAAIAQPQLQQLLETYSRVVLASTEHGYEGTGRSFRIKLQPYLQQRFPQWRLLYLQTPIRYSASDPLEQWLFQTFLLQSLTPAQQISLTTRHDLVQNDVWSEMQTEAFTTAPQAYEVQWWSAAQLIQQPQHLQRCFNLLCLAHYQTAITDLWALLDDPSLWLVSVYQHQQLLAAAVISQEGAFAEELATSVSQGKRRVRGHLLAQSLAYHTGQPHTAIVKSWRVQRVVVEPNLQGKGIGQFLLQQIAIKAQQSQIAFIGTSFGATPPLLNFWQRAGFCAVKLSHKLEQASIAPSVLMLKALASIPHTELSKPLSTAWDWFAHIQQWHINFGHDLYHYARLMHQHTPAPLLLALALPSTFTLSSHSRHQLCRFLNEELTLEQIEPALLVWFNQYRHTIPTALAVLLVQRLWQGYDYSQLANAGQTGIFKQNFVQLLRQELIPHKAFFCDDITL